MGSGLIRELLGIQDPAKAAQMQAHALDMQIKQAQLQKLLAGEPRDALSDQLKQEKLREEMNKQSAIATLGGAGGYAQPSAITQYAQQTGGEHLNEDGSIVSSPEQEAIWQQNNGGYSTGGIQLDQPPPSALQQFAPPQQQAAPSALMQYGGTPDLPPEVLGAIGAIAPSKLGDYHIDKPKRDQEFMKNKRDTAMQMNDLDSGFQSYADANMRAKQTIDELLPKVDNWTAGAGSMLSFIPGTAARDVSAGLETIKSGQLIDALKTLKDSSPTGASGLGSLTEKEGAALKSLVANLDKGQSPAQLKENLGKISTYLDKSFERVSTAYQKDQQAFGVQKPPALDAVKTERQQYQVMRSSLADELARRGIKVKQ
jgi:hypothetical protein